MNKYKSSSIEINFDSKENGKEIGFDKIDILHLSDLHFNITDKKKANFLSRYFEKEYDFVFITGDFINSDSAIGLCRSVIDKFRARYGVFGVIGNHDQYVYNIMHAVFGRSLSNNFKDIRRLIGELGNAGVKVLVDEKVKIVDPNITVLGVDGRVVDDAGNNVEYIFDNVENNSFNILLSHTPDVVLRDGNWKKKVDLVLCGHTHGGQIRLPLIGPIFTRTKLGRRYANGLFEFDDFKMYVSKGIGQVGLVPVRIMCTPEVTEISLNFS